MYNLLVNWEALKAYFTCFEQNCAQYEVKYKERMIKEKLSDHKKYLYFAFASPIVQEFKRVNRLFQSTRPSCNAKKLFLHKTSSENRIHDADGHQKMLYNVDFGVKFWKWLFCC